MSLIKQLWLAILGLMVLVFISSFLISSLSAQSYFEQQLTLKNSDNANSLALVLSQVDKDPITIELLVAAQFDTGNYKRIELLDPQGEVRVQKSVQLLDADLQYPRWFADWFTLDVPPGMAQIQDGWSQYGSLYIESDDRFAYQALWETTWQFFVWFLIVTLSLGVLGTLVLRVLLRPLKDMVKQAEALGARRFVTSVLPNTIEFKVVIQAMNSMTERVKDMLDKETKRLEVLRFKTQHDDLTGLANRQYFMNQFDAILTDEEQEGKHLLVMTRIADLVQLNQHQGHQETDALIKHLAATLEQTVQPFYDEVNDVSVARLNGSDFALLLPSLMDIEGFLHKYEEQLEAFSLQYPDVEGFELPSAAIQFSRNEQRGQILQKLDSLLAQAELQRSYQVCFQEVTHLAQAESSPSSSQGWRILLESVVNHKAVAPQFYPVMTMDNQLLHLEAMMRIQVDGHTHSAGFFLPWAKRLGLLPMFDLMLIQTVVDKLKADRENNRLQPVAINLSIESLLKVDVRDQILQTLSAAPEVCASLHIEMPEKSVLEAVTPYLEFAKQIKALGCSLGLDRVRASFGSIQGLQEVGLDYLKLDAALIQNLAQQDPESCGFVRSLCGLGHSLGLEIIAEGVRQEETLRLLSDLGFDGMTGPAVKLT